MKSTVHQRNDIGKACNSISMSSSSIASSVSPNACRANIYAQELNNSAASCIEVGLHGRAITSLKQALKLYKCQQHPGDAPPSNCYQCTLDGCIVISAEKNCRSPSKNKGDRNDNHFGGFISNRPIKVPTRGQTMGPALCLIILYNLGLVYNLIAIGESDTNKRKKIIHGAIASYNVAYEMHTNLLRHVNTRDPQITEEAAVSLRSTRFTMMILNNMSQLYKLNNEEIKHDRCLRLLLSIVMEVVDQHVRATNVESSISPLWRIKLDGFLRNTISLVLQPEYTADSA